MSCLNCIWFKSCSNRHIWQARQNEQGTFTENSYHEYARICGHFVPLQTDEGRLQVMIARIDEVLACSISA